MKSNPWEITSEEAFAAIEGKPVPPILVGEPVEIAVTFDPPDPPIDWLDVTVLDGGN